MESDQLTTQAIYTAAAAMTHSASRPERL
jgi:hypothetical protein